ncbi:hypothetical protein [Flavisolibacter ginsengisoli]|uniref:Uncharacterized protein n=1 Tax=Flavisolibacter ginsengisoli DSM 18119 TaxID=1121884 RepID=A0A1M5FQY2_9BACT|nr:hypothetical protein [Flavisolibacter ginsengisoli]SHF93839.1 hypothetical protein SAMN02745131_03909 [Flavisolibacter ginsengisoli DSM 18119]
MKRVSIQLCLFLSMAISACSHHRHETSFTVKESHHSYYLETNFNEDLTHDVERYLNDKIGQSDPSILIDGSGDRRITLSDHSSFHLVTDPGYVELKLDKDQNSKASYQRIRSICQGLKAVVIQPTPIDQ